jgi:hypothetical protein
VGTLEPTTLFDARFRPASERTRARWERIALAHRQGVALSPIVVLERPDGYYVVDGRHRVSVALALRLPDIDAYVTATTASASDPKGDRRGDQRGDPGGPGRRGARGAGEPVATAGGSASCRSLSCDHGARVASSS